MVKTIIICDKCGSQEIEYIETQKRKVETAEVLDCDSLDTYFVDRSYEEIAVYKCKKCKCARLYVCNSIWRTNRILAFNKTIWKTKWNFGNINKYVKDEDNIK